MARTSLSWMTGQAKGLIEFDAVEIEAPEHEAVITQYPVELGASLIDHMRVQPAALRLTAWVSNSPVRVNGLTQMDGSIATEGVPIDVYQPRFNPSGSAQLPTSIGGVQLTQQATVRARVRVWGGGFKPIARVQNVYNILKQGQAEAWLFTVTADVGDFKDMLLRRIGYQRSAQMSRALRFELEFLHVDTAKIEQRDISSLFKTESAQPKKDAGKQQPVEADEKTAVEAESVGHLLAPNLGTDLGNIIRGLWGG